MQSKKYRLGLSGKLVLAILAVGAIPLVTSLSVAYYRGSSELQDVIGANFQALAEVSAAKVDAELQRILTVDRTLAQQAADNSEVRTELIGNQPRSKNLSAVQFDWPPITETESVSGALEASWVTGPEAGLNGAKAATSSTGNAAARVTGLYLNSATQDTLLHIAVPIYDRKETSAIGWLHRDYDVKKLFDPLVYPVRFGSTGHVMLINNAGMIVSCPLLATGSRIEDRTLLALVTIDHAGWTTAENSGHGSHEFSIIGYAPLAGVNSLLPSGESWHMFVWQDSREIFAPAKSLLIGVLLAGLLSLGLLGALSYYASRRIVKPVQRLRHEASRIAGGDLSQPLAVHTGDEIEELADEFDGMRIQLRQHIDTLEDRVEERTRELRENQAEKDRVMEQLIQAEKMTAIGTMVSGIGHEINNPLYVIMGRAEAIRDEKDISACNEYARDIIKHGKHISAIVKNLSGYIRPAGQHELEKVDVHEKLAEALAMAKLSQLDDRIEIRQNFAPVPEIAAKPEEIQQVFFNVIRNGIQAMKGKKGILEVTTTLEDGQVCIRIQDMGTGIRTEHLGKIFDPFFTTKGPDEGEGLGMYIVRKIVNKYNGTITLASEVGKGTTVTIRLPGVKSI
ncbi:MAG: HAMP domain-containing protein [Nitrosomonadales bacterium]|nr:HAMP domain-containing protein [Nitrosomonadales bacterium]